jgi:2-polyprenyl-3-methyl-5-hydroxy-6-metoxy-1,4-benzoquinol methylase
MSQEDLDKWQAKYADADAAPSQPSVHLTKLDAMLPRSGTALDIAGGAGRHAIWLAARGLATTLVDISPNALAIASQRADKIGVALTCDQRDLDSGELPAGPFDVVMSFHFLERKIWPAMRQALAPGGWLVFVQPTVRNLERHARPPAGFLLELGEAKQVTAGLEIVSYEEDWLEEGRHESVVIARRLA